MFVLMINLQFVMNQEVGKPKQLSKITVKNQDVRCGKIGDFYTVRLYEYV